MLIKMGKNHSLVDKLLEDGDSYRKGVELAYAVIALYAREAGKTVTEEGNEGCNDMEEYLQALSKVYNINYEDVKGLYDAVSSLAEQIKKVDD